MDSENLQVKLLLQRYDMDRIRSPPGELAVVIRIYVTMTKIALELLELSWPDDLRRRIFETIYIVLCCAVCQLTTFPVQWQMQGNLQ